MNIHYLSEQAIYISNEQLWSDFLGYVFSHRLNISYKMQALSYVCTIKFFLVSTQTASSHGITTVLNPAPKKPPTLTLLR